MQMQSWQDFWIQYPLVILLQAQVWGKCLFQFHSRLNKVGNFSSPHYPGHYPEDLECIYNFLGQDFETLTLTFFTFDLEPAFSKGCLTDYIDVSTITVRSEKHLVGRYCGKDVPSTFLFMNPNAEIIFKTNHVLHGHGFQGMFQFKDEKFISPPVSTPNVSSCGGTLNGVGGAIQSPGYPNSFPKDVECIWLIRVEYNQHIYIRVLTMQLYGSIANCADAELTIYDGYSSISFNPKVLQKYCGDLRYYKNVDEQTQLSGRNRILVRFKTSVTQETKGENADKAVGFKLIWTAVSFQDEGQCPQFVCKESRYCVNSVARSCLETRHYCIDKSLVCNGQLNCGTEDFSDEDKCQLPLLAGCGAAGGVVLLSILIGLCVYRRNVSVKKSISQSQALTMQLRQLEHSPSFASRQVGNFYFHPSDLRSPQDVNCSVHSHYDVIMNNRHESYPTDV